MSIDKLLSKRRTMLALTGVTPEEFVALVPTFESAMKFRNEHEFLSNPKRQRKSGSGIKPFCKTVEEQLLFILLYFKCYPTFDALSFLYDRERSNVWRRYDFLAPILESALGRKLALPKRQITSIEEFWKAFPEAKELFLDGTERPIRRPKDNIKQKANYSGKKKRNTKKNLVITTKKKRINYLSPTVEGKEHDYGLLKRLKLMDHIPKKVRKRVDLGFHGIKKDYPGHRVSIPAKKPKGRPLSNTLKEQNKRKSRIRILVEHALSGPKRLGAIAQTFRNFKEHSDDRAMNIACGLWNYHLDTTTS